MKLTKGRLNQIIKEEIQRVMVNEASQYVLDVFETLKEAIGVEALLDEMVLAMSDSEAMENFKYIARNHDIDLTKKEPEAPEQVSHMGQDADQQIQESSKETK